MDHYIVSARKYRPSTFASVVGQPALTATLKNAIASGRLAHSYLFCGSRGVGKTSCARIFAKTINCQHPTPDGEACNECESCRAFNEGRSLNVIELDAASHNSIEDIRTMIEQVQLPPTSGKYRVFIIDEVHMLSTAAFNAFLKTLEEPPSYVIFILATTEKHKIIPTILSRCQIYDFNRITIRDMVDHLAYVASQEGITADPAALAVIASKADGAMRDALSIFDQVAASSRGDITYQSAIDNLNVLDHAYYRQLMEAFETNDVPKALVIYKQIRDKGFDSQFFVNGLSLYIRDLMLASDPSTLTLLEIPDRMRGEMAQTAAKFPPGFLYKAMDLCNAADLNYRQASNKQFLVELLLIKLCQPLSPSPSDSGDGEGLTLKPIRAARTAADVTAATPASAATAPRTAATAAGVAPQVSTAQTTPPYTSSSSISTPRPRLRTPDLTLRRKTAPTAAATVTAEAPQPRSTAYTDADVEAAWQEFIRNNGSARLLVNIMRNCHPKATAPGVYDLAVENDIQLGLLRESLPDILRAVRDRLANDLIKFTTSTDADLSSPKTWTEREVLEYMKKSNPRFAAFVDEFKLTLL